MAVKLVTYNADLKPDFERLNRHWLEKLFEVEPADKIIFNDKAGLTFASVAGANKITLITDTKLPEAIRLYERYGFQMIPHTPDPRYKRGNVRMELVLASNLHFESNN